MYPVSKKILVAARSRSAATWTPRSTLKKPHLHDSQPQSNAGSGSSRVRGCLHEGPMLCIRRAVHIAREGLVAAELSSCNEEDVLQAQGRFLAVQQ